MAFDESFYKRLVKIKDKAILNKVALIISAAEAAEDIYQLRNIKKMEGFKTFTVYALVITELGWI